MTTGFIRLKAQALANYLAAYPEAHLFEPEVVVTKGMGSYWAGIAIDDRTNYVLKPQRPASSATAALEYLLEMTEQLFANNQNPEISSKDPIGVSEIALWTITELKEQILANYKHMHFAPNEQDPDIVILKKGFEYFAACAIKDRANYVLLMEKPSPSMRAALEHLLNVTAESLTVTRDKLEEIHAIGSDEPPEFHEEELQWNFSSPPLSPETMAESSMMMGISHARKSRTTNHPAGTSDLAASSTVYPRVPKRPASVIANEGEDEAGPSSLPRNIRSRRE
ncbi:hypothetical protein D6D03_10297 [Aureobasidium pullulans]|nr:hypothetical protein D6D03_10297 [Aureobasidium pullulans]